MTHSKSTQRIVLEHLCLASSLALPLFVSSIPASAQSASPRTFRQTSDPYFHSPAVERPAAPVGQQSVKMPVAGSWNPPKTNKITHQDQQVVQTAVGPAVPPGQSADALPEANKATEVWKSLAPKTQKPIQRIDFSKLKALSPVTPVAVQQNFSPLTPQSNAAPAMPPAVEAKVAAKPSPVGNNAGSIIRQQAIPKAATELNFAVKSAADQAIKQEIRQQLSPLMPVAAAKPTAVSGTAPTSQSGTPHSNRGSFDPSSFQAQPLASQLSNVDARVNKLQAAAAAFDVTGPKAEATKDALAEKNPLADKKSDLEIGAFSSEPASLPDSRVVTADAAQAASEVAQATYVQPGDGDFQPGAKLKQLGSKLKQFGTSASKNSPSRTSPSSSDAYRIADATTSTPIYDGIYQENPVAAVVGESFEPSRVVALVGGQPIFVGDMIFEINQLLEKYMAGAPEQAKKQQRAALVKRLLPKYVDQKMLFIATTRQLPEGADIEDVITQAEKTFREKVMFDLMKKSNIATSASFDAHLRSQGSSLRQMRRSWAMDQVSRYFLSEQVKVDEDVTHLDMLNEYRTSYDTYKKNAKCRWEQIEIQFDRAGGRFAAKDQIQEIYDRIVHGGNFQAIAKKESHGFRASAGGQHDWTNKDSLVNKKIDKAIFSLPQGRLSDLIESKTAWHIVRVVERVDEHHTSFEEAQAEIKKEILDKKRDKAFKAYLSDLREQIPVEYYEQ